MGSSIHQFIADNSAFYLYCLQLRLLSYKVCVDATKRLLHNRERQHQLRGVVHIIRRKLCNKFVVRTLHFLPLTLGAEGAPETFEPFADDAAAFTGATTTGAGAALAASFLTGFVLTTGTSSSLSESRAAKLFMTLLSNNNSFRNVSE